MARQLSQDKALILSRWRTEAAAGNEASVVNRLSRSDFYDHIPVFLDRLCAILRGEQVSNTLTARQHAANRWQQGLNFEEVVHEWSLLRWLLMEWIAEHSPQAGLDWPSMQRAYRLLGRALDTGIEKSLVEFNQLQRRKASNRVRSLEATLEERDGLDEQRGHSLHEAAHDLRGSLSGISLVTDLLKARQLDEKTRSLVGMLSGSVAALRQMFDELLDLARLEAGHEERNIASFDAAELFHELRQSLNPLAEQRHLSLTGHGPEALTVEGDAAKVRRIAQNLILNALKYTSAGSVEISWQAESRGHWSFRVHDTGDGLPEPVTAALAKDPDDAERAAQRPAEGTEDATGAPSARPAQAADGVEHGDGIGLSIVHHLCRLLDGVLEVESKLGDGTTFRVLLPAEYRGKSQPLRSTLHANISSDSRVRQVEE
ncbi:MAG: sensor histidine kinase [Gammaproteobacteria bacterium]